MFYFFVHFQPTMVPINFPQYALYRSFYMKMSKQCERYVLW